MYKRGDKVHYIPFKGCGIDKYENGIVKHDQEDEDHVFVVFHCAGEWDNYMDYTAARTNISQLKREWV